MAAIAHPEFPVTHYRTARGDSIDISYREAGRSMPPCLLAHPARRGTPAPPRRRLSSAYTNQSKFAPGMIAVQPALLWFSIHAR